MDLETMMRDAAGEPPETVPHAAIVRRARRRRVLRRSAQSAGALAVIAVAGVLTLQAQQPRSVVLRPASPVDEQTPQASAAPDLQAVSFHGLEILVPAAWESNESTCGTPRRDTFILGDGGGTPTCGAPHRPGLTVARLSRVHDRDPWIAIATSPAQIGGVSALTGTGTIDSALEPRIVMVVPDLGVVLSVTLGDRALAEQIIESARVVDTDSNGCAANVGRLAPSGNAVPDTGLVPPDPSGVTVCRYVDGGLVRSVALHPAVGTALAETLNALQPAGREPLDDSCARDNPGRGFIVHFRYPDAPDADVAAFIDECRLLVDNGVRGGRVDFAVTQALTHAAGYDGGLPNWSELANNDDATDSLSMRMTSDVVVTGEVPRAIIDNQGPSRVTTGLAFELRHWTGTQWKLINRRQGFRAPLVSIGPGTRHQFDVEVFFDTPTALTLDPGRYRVTKTVQHAGRDRRLSADFFVVQ